MNSKPETNVENPTYPSIHPSNHSFIHPFTHPSIQPCIHPSIHSFIHPISIANDEFQTEEEEEETVKNLSVLGVFRSFCSGGNEMKRAAALQLAEKEFCNLCLMPRGRKKER
jgi:hypothetical protein